MRILLRTWDWNEHGYVLMHVFNGMEGFEGHGFVVDE